MLGCRIGTLHRAPCRRHPAPAQPCHFCPAGRPWPRRPRSEPHFCMFLELAWCLTAVASRTSPPTLCRPHQQRGGHSRTVTAAQPHASCTGCVPRSVKRPEHLPRCAGRISESEVIAQIWILLLGGIGVAAVLDLWAGALGWFGCSMSASRSMLPTPNMQRPPTYSAASTTSTCLAGHDSPASHALLGSLHGTCCRLQLQSLPPQAMTSPS